MTVLTRGARPRRGGRRPGWLLLTVLLVLAIMASSALVFTNRVELLKLAVILALWAAVVAAFVSIIYRRQSDADQAKARDLKLVYDLQLDREISARREYELTVETELRRELSTEIRAEAADEVAALRAELAALRANLEYLFDADLSHRPAIETEPSTVRPGRVSSSRIDTDDGPNVRTEENPIIDVPAEPHEPEHEWSPTPLFGGAHRRPSEAEPTPEERLMWDAEQRAAEHRAAEERAAAEQLAAAEQREAEQRAAAEQRATQLRAAEQRAAEERAAELRAAEESAAEERQSAEQRVAEELAAKQAASTDWQPAPAEGQWIPAGMPGSNWASPAAENGSSAGYVGKRRAREPAMSTPPAEARPPGRHSVPSDASDPGRPSSPSPQPTLATPPPQPEPTAAPPQAAAPRHRSAEEAESADGTSTGGYSVAELLARMGGGSTRGGRRRRREE